MKMLPIIASFTLASCVSNKAYLNPDQSISISHRGSALKTMPEDLWISPTKPGVVTPVSSLTVTYTTTIKGRRTRKINCEGFVDRSDPDKIEIRMIQKASLYRPNDSGWVQAPYNGIFKLIPNPTP